jgi:hypothetical protein
MTLPTPGAFAVCGSTTYEVSAVGESWVWLFVEPGAPVPAHLDAGADGTGRAWVKVPWSALERYFRVVVTVAWQGEQFGLDRVMSDLAEILGDSPEVAARLGLEGDPYDGFHATVPVDELTVVDVREHEIGLPADGRRRRVAGPSARLRRWWRRR